MGDVHLPCRLSQWQQQLEQAAATYRMELPILAAHCDVESEGGESPLLDKKGPGGTGDHLPRAGAWFALNPRYKEAGIDGRGSKLYLPADGRGWGRGLMQVDYEFHPAFCDELLPDGRHAWEEPLRNLTEGAALWAKNYAVLRDLLATICAYNAGLSATMTALRGFRGPITLDMKATALNTVTAPPHRYVTVVLDRAKAFRGD